MKSKRAREAATEAAAEDVLHLDNDASTEEKTKKKRKRNDDEVGEQVKQKKAKKDKKKDKKGDYKETRREKKDKRKDLLDLPEEDIEEEEQQGGAAVCVDAGRIKKGEVTSGGSKSAGGKGDEDGCKSVGLEAELEKNKVDQTKKRRDKKDKDKKEDNKDKKEDKKDKKEDKKESLAADTGKADRHIVFVGNLPFSATAASIKAHFATLNPISVRCLKNKGDANPCRGIAFVEFANVWSMRTCLDKFHHTIFEDGISAGRKINVELTAGGGGSTQFRKDKIRDKNIKLDENRAKRIDKEKNDKTAKKQSGAAAKKDQARDKGDVAGEIHPSRLARNPGLRGR
ncbi:hypothetical protein E4U21_003018 [Claviceps maximensis]|nr:hypothetical protein E4U21_003018 [Claviceps maximensis]